MTKAKKDKGADKAYLKAVEEIEKDRVNEVKVVVKQVLEGIVSAQKQEREAKEKLAFLKQDLDDIRAGKIEKIKARHAERKTEQKWVPFDAEKLERVCFRPDMIKDTAYSGIVMTTASDSTIGLMATSGMFNLSDGWDYGTKVKLG